MKYTIYYCGVTRSATGIVNARRIAYEMMLDKNYRHQSAYIIEGIVKNDNELLSRIRNKSTITVQPQGQYARPRDAIKAGHTFTLVKEGRAMYPFQEKRLDGTIKRKTWRD